MCSPSVPREQRWELRAAFRAPRSARAASAAARSALAGPRASTRQILDAADNSTLYRRARLDLSAYLHRHHGEKVVNLIDEYDELIHRSLDKLTRALLGGDAEGFEEQLQAFVTNVLSFHDPGTLDPERVYQGFVVGAASGDSGALLQ